MCNIQIFKDYLGYKENHPRVQEVQVLLGEIEKMLSNPITARERLQYLEKMNLKYDDGDNGIPNPLTEKESEDCVTLGFLDAWVKGKINAEKIFDLVHSIDGLKDLAFSLYGTPNEDLAECWQEYSNIYIDILPVDFEGLSEKEEKSPTDQSDE